MALGRAPRGASVQRARHAFILRIAELLATRRMYRQLVDQLRLTIASTSRMSIAQTTDNVTVEDVARVLAADGVTIPQARDAHEWGLNTLNLWSQVADANRRTEAMQALMTVRQLSSQEDWDRPVPLEPRWWYPSPGNFGTVNMSANHIAGRQEPTMSATVTPTAP